MKLPIQEKIENLHGVFAGSSLWRSNIFFLPDSYTDVFLLPATNEPGLELCHANPLLLCIEIHNTPGPVHAGRY